ncbi:alternative ribosome rescue aminoacyl-tRNA hydrolase ArfB [Pararhodospirillum oryzae]|uniref:Aminoacyl-tRNA hydrolase n=1 Tax=Pararhodospirillum oryzae TaxID=478448 RepID=A0A512HAG8_9PROT|nr:alternative ribosome rescue aminoacyl-tRNA hydrolase ArfB [Pararhodospirillum oryzae]GEO82451.1 aminoacyl-tRNA hydrolase [Pararhodospirillum oryzae]
MRIPITASVFLDEAELSVRFIQSSGPGGQNVNKVATAVQLRLDALGSPSLPEALKARLPQVAGQRLTQGGELVITARAHRTQEANRRDALERLVALLREAAHRDRPRVATRPTHASKRRRLEGKARQGIRKAERGARWDGE